MEPLTIFAAVLVLILGVGRLARIIIWDDFPPAIWFRRQWDRWTRGSTWNKLFHCPFCLTPWITAVAVGWFFIGLEIEWVAWAWWLFWGILGASWISTMIYLRDERPAGR